MSNKLVAQVFGIVLLLAGIVGFFLDPSIFGLFGVNTMHNLVHIVTGLIFVWAGFSKKAPTKQVNKWLGVIYILVAILGFLGLLTFLAVQAGVSDWDNWLHLVIGVIAAWVGWMGK